MFYLDFFGGIFSCKFWGLKGKLKSSNEQFYLFHLFYVQNGSVGVLLSTLPMRTYKMVTLARTPEDIKTSVLQYGMAYRSPASDPCHTVLQYPAIKLRLFIRGEDDTRIDRGSPGYNGLIYGALPSSQSKTLCKYHE